MKLKTMVKNGQSYGVIHSEIEVLRAGDLILRDKAREMADAYRTRLTCHDDVASFFGRTQNLFGYWNGDHHSGTLRILTALEEGEGEWDREFLLDSIEMTISASQDEWKQVANQHADIRVDYLLPTKITVGRRHNTLINVKRSETDSWSTRLLKSIRDFRLRRSG
ncbi:MAG: hypothetical protein ACJ746_29115 [Bryobacteraceae bacterium]